MGEDKQPGPDEMKHKMPLGIPDDAEDTEGHKKRVVFATGDPDGGPDEMKHKMPLGIPDSDDDTVGHKK